MSDFIAKIVAELDTTKIPSSISEIEKKEIKFNNFTLNSSELVSKIQKALDSQQFSLNLTNVKINNPAKNISGQMKNAGASAGREFANSFNNSASSISTTANNAKSTIQHMQKVLKNMNFGHSSIDVVTKDLSAMNLEISNISTKINKNGLNVSVRGIDELGRAVTVVKQFDNESGKITSAGTIIAQSFDTSADAAKRYKAEVNSAFNDILKIQKQMGNYRLEIAGLDELKDASQIETIKSKLGELKTEYNKLYAVFGKHFSTEQTDRLIQGFNQVDDEIDILKSKMSDALSLKNTKEEIKELLSIARQMDSLKLDIKKSESKGNSNEATFLTNKLSKLQTQYKSLLETLYRKLPHDQFLSLIDGASNAEAILERFDAKLNDTRQQTMSKINFGISSGDFEGDINLLSSKLKAFEGATTETATNAKNNFEALKTAFATMKNTDAGDSERIAAFKEYNRLLPIVKKQITEVASAQQTLTKSKKLSNDIQTWLQQNAKAAEKYGDVLNDLRNKLENNTDGSEFSKASAEFARIKSEAKSAGLIVGSFGKQVKQAVTQMLGLGSSVMVLQKIVQVFKVMYRSVYEIDTAMTNLYKVTDETGYKYQQFLSDANKSAQELGKTVSSLIEQTATWAKLGYSIDDSANLAKLSSVYANVAEIDDKTAVSDMVTAMKAFKIEAKDAVTIIDPLNELGNNFATSAGDLGNGLTRAASAMQLAGSDIYETLAMLTGGAEITQNANEFGNMLKIGSMRIRGMKGELEELGEEVNENVDSISKVQTQILNLTKGKVNIFDDMGEFRGYYEIMMDISEVYNDLASTDQAALMETLFGKLRGNQGAALIQAFQSGQVQKAYETAKNSAGSAMAEQEKWMESLEAKTQQLKASFQTLSNTVLDSDFLKGMIDSGTTLLNILTAIVDKIGVFNTIAISGGIAAFVKNLD